MKLFNLAKHLPRSSASWPGDTPVSGRIIGVLILLGELYGAGLLNAQAILLAMLVNATLIASVGWLVLPQGFPKYRTNWLLGATLC